MRAFDALEVADEFATVFVADGIDGFGIDIEFGEERAIHGFGNSFGFREF